jgi:hypothetical protein
LIILILFYLDTRKSTDDPAPWWLFIPGIDYTENGFIVAAHYPRRMLDEDGQAKWGFKSMVITDRFVNVLKSPEKKVEKPPPRIRLKQKSPEKKTNEANDSVEHGEKATQAKQAKGPKRKGRASLKPQNKSENDSTVVPATPKKFEIGLDESKVPGYAPANSKGRVQALAALVILFCHASKLLDELCKWDPDRANDVLKVLQEMKQPASAVKRGPKQPRVSKTCGRL